MLKDALIFVLTCRLIGDEFCLWRFRRFRDRVETINDGMAEALGLSSTTRTRADEYRDGGRW